MESHHYFRGFEPMDADIGKARAGNPWLFNNKLSNLREKAKSIVETILFKGV
jgi:hypothetical protein